MNCSVIRAIESYAIRIPRDLAADRGTAGSPARLQRQDGARYSIAQTYATVYSDSIESTLVKITTEDGLVGWGEAQAPVVPEATQSIIDRFLRPLLIGLDALAPAQIHQRLYDAMRVRGHFGGFYGDAIAAIDCALWDIAGQHCAMPVHRMLGGPVRERIPAYISGLAGASAEEKLADAERYFQDGFRAFKIFLADSQADCLTTIKLLRKRFGSEVSIFVDALWRLTEKQALSFCRALSEYDVEWLEAPLPPEDLEGHKQLSTGSPISIAIGESYRSMFEFLPFLESRAMQIAQPDIGRIGITEGLRISALAQSFHVAVAPHVSIALGPQIASALQVAAAIPNLLYIECNPRVLQFARRFSDMEQIDFGQGSFSVPQKPGLGITMSQEELAKVFSSAGSA